MLTALATLVLAPRTTCCDPMAAFVSDPAFVAAHLAPLPLRFAPLEGKDVTFYDADNQTARGFYVPPKSGHHVGIVMVHEWWGLNDYIRREAERLNEETGYGVLAVDLYGGKVATTPDEAGKFMQTADPKRSGAIVRGAVMALRGGSFGARFSKIGSIGWCFGGGWSFQTALQSGKFVNACVMYYGMPETDPAKLKALKAPVIMFWGTKDKWINEALVQKFSAGMRAAHKSLETKAYDADHAFANPSNPHFDRDASADANERTLSFYKRTLGEQ